MSMSVGAVGGSELLQSLFSAHSPFGRFRTKTAGPTRLLLYLVHKNLTANSLFS